MLSCLVSSIFTSHLNMNLNYPLVSNRRVIESRPFDFIYDPEYRISTSKNFYKLAENAIKETAEQDIRPIYESMFSDVRRFPKHQLFLRTEMLPISWEEKKAKELMSKSLKESDEVSGRDRYKYISKSNIDMPIKIRFENFTKSSAHKINIESIGQNEAVKTKSIDDPLVTNQIQKLKSTKSTQTDYRDSETQTDPWIPPYDEKLKSLLFLKPEQGSLIEYEVDTVEEKRKINELQKTLSTLDKRNLKTQIAITKKIERITWLVKEKKIDYINTTRMELAEKILYKKSIETQMNIKRREESYRDSQTEWKNHKIENVLRNKERDVRKLEHNYHSEMRSVFFKAKFEEEPYSTCRNNYFTNELYNFY